MYLLATQGVQKSILRLHSRYCNLETETVLERPLKDEVIG